MSGWDLNTIGVFVAVAEGQSFSAASRRLGMSPSGASRAISRLEKRLGIRLLQRTTRSVALTADGAVYLERCRKILADVDDAHALVSRAGSVPQGRLRLYVPVGFGRKIVVPALPAFVARYPEITLDVELNDRPLQPRDHGVEVAIRVGEVGDTGLVARHLCNTKFVTCASPAYLEAHGEPRTPEALRAHRCLAYAIPGTGRYREWEFARNGRSYSVAVSGPLNINGGEALVDTAIAGVGIVTVASFIAAEAIASGKLKLILRDYMAAGPAVSVTYLPARPLPARVRALINFLREIIPPEPPWERVL
ncbi:MAG TPA: LysR family transcriptional regulator [Burkholderiales bacterium]|nr:LysR family transcriptional regulator [Burkholderiales bacterium]